MEFTKEQLIEQANIMRESAEKMADWEGQPGERARAALGVIEIALAALTAPTEPVYQYRIRNCYNGQVTEWQTIKRDQVDFVLKAQPHNAEFQIITPPVPQLPQPAVPEFPPEHLLPQGSSRDACYRRGAIINGWKLCRAAMLEVVPQKEAK